MSKADQMFKKYQNTLNWLRETTISLKHNEAYNILQELVDKETPMKPTELETGKYSCDSCAMAFTVKDLKYRFLSHTYCDICGQKIDWSVKNE